jgi:coenzyme F420 hydrogenase subunit beta
MKSIEQVVQTGLCISCGACANGSLQHVSLLEIKTKGVYVPEVPAGISSFSEQDLQLCPGAGYAINALARELYPDAKYEDIYLGRWSQAVACHATSSHLLESASSGGIMTAIAYHLLETGRVDAVVATRIQYGARGPRPEVFLASSLDELLQAQGSKYCPVPQLEILPTIKQHSGKVLFIGTPCQIAGLRLLQKRDPSLRQKIPFVIGNFCGGFRDLRETDALVKQVGMDPAQVIFLRYRGGGQPGSMRIFGCDGTEAILPYPGYARMSGFIKHLRCRLCVDATAELADFSCGDAWLPRFLRSPNPWSLLLTRSAEADQILAEMIAEGKVAAEEVSTDEIKTSQRGNLTAKKVRYNARRRLRRLFGLPTPQFDGGFLPSYTSLVQELKIQASHSFLYCLQRLSLYPPFAKLIRRYPHFVLRDM